MTGDHLRLAGQRVVDAVQRVPDHVTVVDRHSCGGPDRIGIRQIGLRHEAQTFAAAPCAIAGVASLVAASAAVPVRSVLRFMMSPYATRSCCAFGS